MSFSASFDRNTKIISAIVCLGLLAVAVFVHNFVAACLSLLVLALCVAYSPRGYVVEGQSILVKRLAGAVRIPLAGVHEARRATPDDFHGCVRLWGSGGLFGYYGVFSTSKLGKSTWYLTNRNNAIVVTADAKTLLFSPDDTAAFLTAIQTAAPRLAKVDIAPAAIAARSFGPAKIIGIGVALAALGVIAVATSYSPGPPSYTLTSESLTIHDRFFPMTLQASSVDISGLRIIDLDQDTQWRPKLRTNGFANSHYQSGWFQVANGQKVRMYRAGGWRLVMLPPSGAGSPVLYQAADPEMFMEQLHAMWGHSTRSASTEQRKAREMDAQCAVKSSSRSQSWAAHDVPLADLFR